MGDGVGKRKQPKKKSTKNKKSALKRALFVGFGAKLHFASEADHTEQFLVVPENTDGRSIRQDIVINLADIGQRCVQGPDITQLILKLAVQLKMAEAVIKCTAGAFALLEERDQAADFHIEVF